MIWYLESWQYPCYNINNGRCKSLLKWKNTKNIIYEETTNNIIPILSLKRPHSRAFFLSIIGIILSFFVHLNIISFKTLKKLYDNNDICNIQKEIKILTLFSYISATFSRIIFGILCDKYGVRISYCIIILLSVIFNIIIINNDNNKYLYLLNGISSAGFVLSEIWIITMFDTNILGLTMGIIGGIGNFGYGIQLIINYNIIINVSNKYLLLFTYWPYIFYLLLIYPIYCLSDDCPYGNYNELKKIFYTKNINNNTDNDNDNDNE